LQEEQLAIHKQATAEAVANAKVTIESLIAEAEAARAKAMSEKGGAAAAVSALTAKAKLAGMWREKVDQHNTGSPVYERIERVIVERAPQSVPNGHDDGGRRSGKSHFFGELTVEKCLVNPGMLAVCIREVQKSLLQSSKRFSEPRRRRSLPGATRSLVTPGDGLIIFHGMQDSTAESIKSLEGFDVAWVEEAQTLSARSLSLLRPTIRKEGSELANWNPQRKKDAIDEFLRQKKPDNAMVKHSVS
jgi:hypothetical protein